MALAGGAGDEDRADAVGGPGCGLLCHDLRCERAVGVKRCVGRGDQAVKRTNRSSLIWLPFERAGAGSAGPGRPRRRRQLAKTPKITFSGTWRSRSSAEAPVGEAAATDADQVHDAVAGRAQLGAHDLAQDRHVVAVEEAPAEPEQDRGSAMATASSRSAARCRRRTSPGRSAPCRCALDVDPAARRCVASTGPPASRR